MHARIADRFTLILAVNHLHGTHEGASKRVLTGLILCKFRYSRATCHAITGCTTWP